MGSAEKIGFPFSGTEEKEWKYLIFKFITLYFVVFFYLVFGHSTCSSPLESFWVYMFFVVRTVSHCGVCVAVTVN